MQNVIHTGQKNANVGKGLLMRAGIPHKGGKLAAHAVEQEYPAMVSASAFWNTKKRAFYMPDFTDLHNIDWALDSAGFTAMKSWAMKGTQPGMAGVFPWTYEQYLELASESGASWYSAPDMCCEPELAGDQDQVDYRVNATATLLEGVLRIVYAWQNELAKTCSANVVSNLMKPPVPIIQGWTADDYRRSLDLTVSVWERWQPWLATPTLLGIGSVCRRDLHHPTHGLFAILDALEGRLPTGSRVHLFGVKGLALPELVERDWIASVDSMAWDLQSRIKSHKEGVSNSFARRTAEMTSWMSAAQGRMGQQARFTDCR